MDGKKKVSFQDSSPSVSSEDILLAEVKDGGAQDVNKPRQRKLTRAASTVTMETTLPDKEAGDVSPHAVVSTNDWL